MTIVSEGDRIGNAFYQREGFVILKSDIPAAASLTRSLFGSPRF
jgi:hypothetical protein